MGGDLRLRKLLEKAVETTTTYDEAWRAVMSYGQHHVWAITQDIREQIKFNCFAYALCVNGEPEYLSLVEEHRSSVLVNSEFVKELIKDNLLSPVEQSDFDWADIILYYDGDKLTHAAMVAVPNKLLRSKWGTGCIYEHALWEVPASYGSTVKIARAPDPRKVIERLKALLKS